MTAPGAGRRSASRNRQKPATADKSTFHAGRRTHRLLGAREDAAIVVRIAASVLRCGSGLERRGSRRRRSWGDRSGGVDATPAVFDTGMTRARVRAPGRRTAGAGSTPAAATCRSHATARQDRAARLLDLLLRQLPARARRAAPARGEVRRRPWSPSACTRREVRARAEHAAVVAAVESYGVHHPCSTTRPPARGAVRRARAWPTLALVDPRRATSSRSSAAGATPALDRMIAELVAEHEAKGTLHRLGPHTSPRACTRAALSRARRSSSTTARCSYRLRAPLASGPPRRRWRDAADASATAPADCTTGTATTRGSASQRSLLLPPDVVARTGYDVVVADTEPRCCAGRHRDRTVTTLRGRRAQWMQGDPPRATPAGSRSRACGTSRGSTGAVVVAMAGCTGSGLLRPRRGDRRAVRRHHARGLVDGEADRAWFAQTSSLPAASADGTTLWLADSRPGAAPRAQWRRHHRGRHRPVRLRAARRRRRASALLAPARRGPSSPDGSVAVADTYNGAVRRFGSTRVTTLTRPSRATFLSRRQQRGQVLLVVESAAHWLVRVPLPDRRSTSARGVPDGASRCSWRPGGGPRGRVRAAAGARSRRHAILDGVARRMLGACRRRRRRCRPRSRAAAAGSPAAASSTTPRAPPMFPRADPTRVVRDCTRGRARNRYAAGRSRPVWCWPVRWAKD